MDIRIVYLFFLLFILFPFSNQALNLSLQVGSVNRTNVVWMVPSWVCKGENFIEVEKYGVKTNQDQSFIGGKVFAIFYEHSFGKIPFFKGQNVSRPMNGGLPQTGNLSAHLIEAEKNIKETIPDENFNGIAVIDIEEFRPMWRLSWGKFAVYKTESIRLVRQQYPYWPAKQIEWQAERDYEKASQKFFIETIRLGKKLRPKAKWGYYLFPKCNGDVGQKYGTECSKLFQQFNDQMSWLWAESTALFPSIYLYPQHKLIPDFNFVNTGALLMETRRVKRAYCPHCEIHIFTKIEYDSYHYPEDFYSKQNLASTLELSVKMNVNSVVIWSTSQNIQNRCGWMKMYVSNTLGPFIQLVNRSLDKCREDRCEGRGECFLSRPKRNPASYNYSCRCERPFFGKSCEYRGRRLGFSLPRTNAFSSFPSPDRYNAANQFYAPNGSLNSTQ